MANESEPPSRRAGIPQRAAVFDRGAALFAAVKMALTGAGVVTMVLLARYRFMRLVRVELVMYAVFAAYVGLLAYEFRMLRALVNISNCDLGGPSYIPYCAPLG